MNIQCMHRTPAARTLFRHRAVFIAAALFLVLMPLQTSWGQESETKPAAVDNKKKYREDLKKHEEKAADNIEATLKYGVNQDRIQAINAVHTIKTDSIRNRLLGKLVEMIKTERNADVLEKAIIVASDHNVSEAVSPITEHLDHPTEEVRIAAVYAVKRLDARSTKEKLIALLKKQDLSEPSNYIEALIQTLGDFKATEIIDYAIEGIGKNDTSRGNREQLVLFLGRLSSEKSKEFLLKLYTDEEEDLTIRSFAVNSLAKLKATEAGEKIREVLDSIETYPFKRRQRYYTLYIYSIAALAKLGDKEAVERLIDSLRSDNTMIRYRAVRLLGEFKDKRTIDILKYKLNNDPSPKVREAAKKALEDLGVKTEDDGMEGESSQ